MILIILTIEVLLKKICEEKLPVVELFSIHECMHL